MVDEAFGFAEAVVFSFEGVAACLVPIKSLIATREANIAELLGAGAAHF
jgi:hypothetical protein